VTNATDERGTSFIHHAIEFLAKADDKYVDGYACSAKPKTEADNSDLTATLHAFPGLSLLASYVHIDATITQDAFFPVGNRLDGVPADSGRFWVNYKVPDCPFRNVTMGAGLYAASSQAVGLDNDFFVRGFVTFDAKLGYEIAGWSFAVIGKNLASHNYFVPYPFEVDRVAPGEPLTVLAAVSVRQ
jgi:iron complex outermembrane recepter protein